MAVALALQMPTIWPLDEPSSQKATEDNCPFLIDHYDLYGGISAIADAQRQGADVDGEGPFLIGWSPAQSRGDPAKVLLVVDMSSFRSQDSFNKAFQFWQTKIVRDPSLWLSGFSIERTRLAIRDFVDRYGQDIGAAVKLIGIAR
jgi:hypothetical protein